MKNINKAYEACLSTKPRDDKFKQLLNLGTWEAKAALYRLLTEKATETLSLSEREILKNLTLEGIPKQI